MKDLKVGSQPAAIAFSPLSQPAYVANEGDGTIAISAAKHDVLARIQTEPGVRVISIPPTGHYGIALNTLKNTLTLSISSSNRVVQKVPVGPGSDQLSFTKQFAYVRSSGSEFVTMINMTNIGKEANVTRFPAGQRAPGESLSRSHAASIVPAPEEGAVLVANPADKMIYYYTEGMAAPMGSFQNYKRDPRALLVTDNSLRETARGVYSTTARLNNAGPYDVAFLLTRRGSINCFEIKVARTRTRLSKVERALQIEPVVKEAVARPATLQPSLQSGRL